MDENTVLVGRVVVLPEYRGKHLGSRAISEVEKWIAELGYADIVIDARLEATGFYERLGYKQRDGEVFKSWKFDCTRMVKRINV
ncbi:MAG: GNAT family N-acetyltransferase [Ruminococcus sp.]|nr:GNAT family N-acetyltransferase [Ruminococcus sp.]